MAALAAYRNLLRASRLAFQGDAPVLNSARQAIRDNFQSNSSIEPSSPEIPEKLQYAQDVATILRQNVVQGRKDGDVYKLRIHEHTERGDNDTIRTAGGKTAKIKNSEDLQNSYCGS